MVESDPKENPFQSSRLETGQKLEEFLKRTLKATVEWTKPRVAVF